MYFFKSIAIQDIVPEVVHKVKKKKSNHICAESFQVSHIKRAFY